MRRQYTIRIAVAAVVAMGVGGAFAQQQQPQPPAAVDLAKPVTAEGAAVGDVNGAVESIRKAADPSAAVSAYAAAVSGVGNQVAVADAYVRKMVEFGLPDLAEVQAREILKQDERNDVARAVVAYVQGRRGQAADALATIVQVTSGGRTPSDPFVLRTAGQLLAWYDTRADKSAVADPLQKEIEVLRRKVSGEEPYRLAYGEARDAYNGEAAAGQGQQQQQVPPGTTVQVPASEPTSAPSGEIPAYTHSAPAVVQPAPAEAPAQVYSEPTVYAPPPTTYYPYASPYYSYSDPYWYRYGGYYGYAPYYGPAYIPPPVIIKDRHHHHDGHHGGKDWGHGGHHGGGGGRGDHDGHHGGGGRPGEPRVHRFDDIRNRTGDKAFDPPAPRVERNSLPAANVPRPTPTQAQVYQRENRPKDPAPVVVREPKAPAKDTPSRRVEAPPSRRVEAPPSRRVETPPSRRVEAPPSRRVEAPPSRRVEAPPSRSASPSPSRSPDRIGSGGSSGGSSRGGGGGGSGGGGGQSSRGGGGGGGGNRSK